MHELQIDGLVGPTHSFAGLAQGNLASAHHQGKIANPKLAALQGIAKMRWVHQWGVPQAVFPPHERPAISWLKKIGFVGSDGDIIAQAIREGQEQILRMVSSASAMWAANAATVVPSSDTFDRRVHVVTANLVAQPHRSLEAPFTFRVLQTIFSDTKYFQVSAPLPGGMWFGDEGAANHSRLVTEHGAVHIFGWGAEGAPDPSLTYAARQTKLGSTSVARLLQIKVPKIFARQGVRGLNAGGFHSDVLTMGHGSAWVVHEAAWEQSPSIIQKASDVLGKEFASCLVTEAELPLAEAVKSYPFNSQWIEKDNRIAILAPSQCEQNPTCQTLFQRLQAEIPRLSEIVYMDLKQSMANGGGPACLRLRVPLTAEEMAAVHTGIFVDDAKLDRLESWVHKHYRDRLSPNDLGDPLLVDESQRALDELTQLLQLGSLYDFQQ
jgi:succinylarginine dihydrolase